MKRTEAQILEDIKNVYCGLSPENLHCDGEASKSYVRQKYTQLTRQLKQLFKELGREVEEYEAFYGPQNRA
jgi:hypothetical protein